MYGRGWQITASLGPPPVTAPPKSADLHDVAYSENAIRFEALPDLMGIRDVLWTLGNHVKRLKMETISCALSETLSEAAAVGCELSSTPNHHNALYSTSSPSRTCGPFLASARQ